MNKSVIHRSVFRILVPPVIGLFSYLVILLIFNELSLLTDFFVTQELYVMVGLTYVLFEWERYLSVLVNRFFPFSERGMMSILLQVGIALLSTILVVRLGMYFYYNFVMGFSISPNLLTVFYVLFLMVTLMYQLFYFGLFFLYQRHQDRYIEESRRNDEMVESMVRFKSEINPKMLYNSLESLIVIARRDQDEADDFINDLSGLYRYILSNKQSELIGLSTELQMSARLLRLINHKYQNAIFLDSDIEDLKKSLLLIPGTLPKIVEYIIEMSIVTPDLPLRISFEFDHDNEYLVVSYDLNERLNLVENNTISEMQNSYSFYSDRPVVHVKAYGKGYIKIPALLVTDQQTA